MENDVLKLNVRLRRTTTPDLQQIMGLLMNPDVRDWLQTSMSRLLWSVLFDGRRSLIGNYVLDQDDRVCRKGRQHDSLVPSLRQSSWVATNLDGSCVSSITYHASDSTTS